MLWEYKWGNIKFYKLIKNKIKNVGGFECKVLNYM